MRLVIAAAALAGLSAPALAQGAIPQGHAVSERVIVERRAGVPLLVQGPRGRVCVPWCPADSNPCDPPEFKSADGRCSNENQ